MAAQPWTAPLQPTCSPGAQPQTRRLTASLETKVVIRVSTRLTSLCVDADFQWRSSSYRLSTSWLLAMGQRVREEQTAARVAIGDRYGGGQQLAAGLVHCQEQRLSAPAQLARGRSPPKPCRCVLSNRT